MSVMQPAVARPPYPESLDAFMSSTQEQGQLSQQQTRGQLQQLPMRAYRPQYRQQFAMAQMQQARAASLPLAEEPASRGAPSDTELEADLRTVAQEFPLSAVAFLISRLDEARRLLMTPSRDECAAFVDMDAWLADRPSPSAGKHDWIGALHRPFVPPA